MESKIYYFALIAFVLIFEVKAGCEVNDEKFKTCLKFAMKRSNPIYSDGAGGCQHGLCIIFGQNAAVKGFSDCDIEYVKVSKGSSKLSFGLCCPNLIVEGPYFINGSLFNLLPVYGGDDIGIINTKDYELDSNTQYKCVRSPSGKDVPQIGDFKLDMKCKGGIVFDMRNLYYGVQLLSDIAHGIANTNWKPLAEQHQLSVFNPFFYKFIQQVNDCLLKG